ncbi:MAG TPA: 4'-phosphopantetheinyl transferase superfamily protein [Micromonosporaceae bacterium]|nr:4'-phosphopantetheinyl transferase superfamily protein [Micromonosporaceae bacterium]
MIERIVPPVVAAVDAFQDLPDVELFDVERAAIARAVEKRRREFTTVRACARAALAKLGLPPAPIIPGQRGAPEWPPGIIGSMTHCAGYRAAAVAHAGEVAAIGLDAEPNAPLPPEVLLLIARPEERSHLRELAEADRDVCWDRLLFSAKESVYKAWFPLTGRWLDFAEATLTVDPAAGSFSARLLVPGPVTANGPVHGFDGRFLVSDGLLLTAIVLLA